MLGGLSCVPAWRVPSKPKHGWDNPRCVVTSLEAPSPQQVYEDLYCARGTGENAIKWMIISYPCKTTGR